MTTSTSALPALPVNPDPRSIMERVNAAIKNIYNKILPVGPAGSTLISDGTTFAWQADARVLQVVSTETGAVATGTTIIPFDDTIPQSTEGDQYMSLAITPKSAASNLIIEVIWTGCLSAANPLTVALFQDANANALATTFATAPFSFAALCIPLRHVMVSGTTSTTTFKVRAGDNTTGTLTFNGQGGGRLYGGVMASSIVIQEVTP